MMKVVQIAAALFAASLAVPAPAETDFATYRTSVSIAGLDLASRGGIRALDLRLLHAATALCETASSADTHGAAKAKRCRDQALATAAADRARTIAAAQQNAAQTAHR